MGVTVLSDRFEYQHKTGEDDQEAKVEQGELLDVAACLAGVMLGVLVEGDQAGQGSDQAAYAADVHAHQQIRIVAGELRQQNGGRHIADKLAGEDGEQQGTLAHQVGEEAAHRINPCHIAGKNEEEHKGQKQGIVYHLQSLAIRKQQNQGNHNQADPVGDTPENDSDRQCKQGKIQRRSADWQGNGFIFDFQRLCLYEEETAECDKGDGQQKRRCHDAHELQVGDLKFGIEVQVLGIAEGGEHAAQVRGDVLHDKGKGHVLLLSGGGEHEVSQGQEGQQCHVVGNEHGANEGDVDQCQNAEPGIAEALNDFLSQNVEEADVLQGTDYSQNAEQAGQGLEIEIAQIGAVNGNDGGCDQCGDESNHHNGVGFQKGEEPFRNGKMGNGDWEVGRMPDRSGTAGSVM